MTKFIIDVQDGGSLREDDIKKAICSPKDSTIDDSDINVIWVDDQEFEYTLDQYLISIGRTEKPKEE